MDILPGEGVGPDRLWGKRMNDYVMTVCCIFYGIAAGWLLWTWTIKPLYGYVKHRIILRHLRETNGKLEMRWPLNRHKGNRNGK